MNSGPDKTSTKQTTATPARAKSRNFIYHLHPPKIAKRALRFDRTFGLGGMAVLLFLIQALTGMLLRFVYVPTPAEAYDSILLINREVLFGSFVRNIHHWAGIFFVIITFLHFVRTFLAQTYYPPRRVNWVLGVLLLFLVVFSNFTGYLLPWDQLSYWAVTVATNMLDYFPLIGNGMQEAVRGGSEVGSATLLNFYTFHTGILPVAILIIMIYHFWKVRKAKGLALPVESKATERVPTDPDLLSRELVVGLTLIAILFLLSVFFSAPLQERANPAYSPNPAKAPWYFMGVQELLMHMHPIFSVVVLPVLYFGGLFYLPYYRWKNPNPGYWFHSEKGKKLVVEGALLALFLTPAIVLIDEYIFRFQEGMKGLPLWISQGVIPFVFVVLTLSGYLVYLQKRRKANAIERIVVLFVVVNVSYLVLTVVGIWFRGEGMVLIWPWEV
jgi:quinol-cytochrome oxidoreductase complex cytochrome b subunit